MTATAFKPILSSIWSIRAFTEHLCRLIAKWMLHIGVFLGWSSTKLTFKVSVSASSIMGVFKPSMAIIQPSQKLFSTFKVIISCLVWILIHFWMRIYSLQVLWIKLLLWPRAVPSKDWSLCTGHLAIGHVLQNIPTLVLMIWSAMTHAMSDIIKIKIRWFVRDATIPVILAPM